MILWLATNATAKVRGMVPTIKGNPRRKCRLLIMSCVHLLFVVAGVLSILSLMNMRAVVNNALSNTVQHTYQRNLTVMWVREYWPTYDPREIIVHFTRRHRQKTSREVNEQDTLWRQD